MAFTPTNSLDGEAITQEVYLIPNDPLPTPPTLDLPAQSTKDCCSAFALFALADTTTTDQFKNDRAGILFWVSSAISSATLKLQKYESGAWVDKITFTDNTYGINYPFQFFVNDAGEQFIGYDLDWRTVLSAFGVGSYRGKVEVVASYGGTGEDVTPEYCLDNYSPAKANKTVKIEYYLNGVLGTSDDKLVKDLGTLNWYNSLRLFGFFGFPESTYESDYIQYDNGQKVWVEDEQEPEYTLKLQPTAAFIHDIMRTDVLQADQILITDYNANNAQSFIQKAVIKNSEYAPNWNKLQNKLATVEVKFIQEYNNLKKLRC